MEISQDQANSGRYLLEISRYFLHGKKECFYQGELSFWVDHFCAILGDSRLGHDAAITEAVHVRTVRTVELLNRRFLRKLSELLD